MKPSEGRSRVVIEAITPQVELRPLSCPGASSVMMSPSPPPSSATATTTSPQSCLFRRKSERRWRSTPMQPLGNDLWSASFPATEIGAWEFTIQAWVDHFDTWTSDLRKRLAAQPDPSLSEAEQAFLLPQDIPLALRTGALLLEGTAKRARAKSTHAFCSKSSPRCAGWPTRTPLSTSTPSTPPSIALAARYPDLSLSPPATPTIFPFGSTAKKPGSPTWYELFPRSASSIPGQHGTLADVEAHLPEIAAMGFDVLYLPPIHPIGTAYRKGKNNATTAEPGDVGSPWAIGAARTKTSEGGHKSIHPELGTLKLISTTS